MSARTCSATEAEMQVLATVVASPHAMQYVAGVITADDFGSIRHRRLYEAACENGTSHMDERLTALAEAAGWDERELRYLLDRPERSCLIDALRYARRMVECARARELDHLLTVAHDRLRTQGQVEPVVTELSQLLERWVA